MLAASFNSCLQNYLKSLAGNLIKSFMEFTYFPAWENPFSSTEHKTSTLFNQELIKRQHRTVCRGDSQAVPLKIMLRGRGDAVGTTSWPGFVIYSWAISKGCCERTVIATSKLVRHTGLGQGERTAYSVPSLSHFFLRFTWKQNE